MSNLETKDDPENVPAYLSVEKAARILGVSERSIYGYVASKKLPGTRIGKSIAVRQEDVEHFKLRPGRLRLLTPRWRMAPIRNRQFLTTITVRLRPGQDTFLADRLAEMRRYNRSRFPGTTARAIVRNQCNPDVIEILLFWRSASMPNEQEREAVLVALAADMVEVFDWETACVKEGQVLLHAQ